MVAALVAPVAMIGSITIMVVGGYFCTRNARPEHRS